jgi:hypothetical protein
VLNSSTQPARKPTRLKTFDYSQPGYYFVTLCTNKRGEYFWSNVELGEKLNDAGVMVRDWLLELEKAFACSLDCWCIMPNHIHVVIVINNNQISPVGADLCVGPNQGIRIKPNQDAGGHISPPLQKISP